MATLSDRLRACLTLDPTAEAVVHVRTDDGESVSLVKIAPEELFDISELEDRLVAARARVSKAEVERDDLAREQRMREQTRLAPPPVAYGACDALFAVLADPNGEPWFRTDIGGMGPSEAGTREHADDRVCDDTDRVVRLVDADAPVVDIKAIREVCHTGKQAVEKWGKGAVDFVQFLDAILVAIGDREGT